MLFTTSGVGRRGRAYWGAYGVSKFGIEALTQILAAELENISDGARQRLESRPDAHAMRRQAYPAEDARLAAAACDRSRAVPCAPRARRAAASPG